MRRSVRWKVEKCGCLCDLDMGDDGRITAYMVQPCAEHKGVPDAAGKLWRAVVDDAHDADAQRARLALGEIPPR